MDGYQYERRCAGYLEENGFTGITVTPGSGDQGVDIIAYSGEKKYGIQCKYYEGVVGNKAVQEVYAGAAFYSCEAAMVITNATFTKAAVELAQKLGVELRAGVNAIVLQESTRNTVRKTSPKNAEAAEEARLERMMEERYAALRRKYPQNRIIDAEVETLAYRLTNNAASIASSCRVSFEFAVRDIESAAWSRTKTPAQEKRKAKEKAKEYSGEFADLLEKADRAAGQYLASGVSERSVEVLADMIAKIYKCGEIKATQYMHLNRYMRGDEVYAETKWLVRHKRIAEKWKEAVEQLPSRVESREKAQMAQYTRYESTALENGRAQVNSLTAQIKDLRARLDTQEQEKEELQTQLKDLQKKLKDNRAAYRACDDRISQAEKALKDEMASAREAAAVAAERTGAVVSRIREAQNALAHQGLFAFQKKKSLQEQIQELEAQLPALHAEENRITGWIDSIPAMYQKQLQELQAEKTRLEGAAVQAEKACSACQEKLKEYPLEDRIALKQKQLKAAKAKLPKLEAAARPERIAYMKRVLGIQ